MATRDVQETSAFGCRVRSPRVLRFRTGRPEEIETDTVLLACRTVAGIRRSTWWRIGLYRAKRAVPRILLILGAGVLLAGANLGLVQSFYLLEMGWAL